MISLDAALLQALRAHSLYCSGSELAQQLQVTLSVLEARIEELRLAGFEILERPGLGYRLESAPDRLIADDLLSRLGAQDLIREILVFAETDSTNERAAELGRNGAAQGVAIFAERQQAGRGRFGRRWESASHLGLWLSLLLRPGYPMLNWPRLTTTAAVAMAAAIEESVPGVGPVQIKWPNDIYIAGRKVAGILIETGIDRAQQPFAVLGMGLNVNHAASDFPAELADKASSLREAAGHNVDRAALAVKIFQNLEPALADVEFGFARIVAEASRRSSLLGRWIQLRVGDSVLEGVAEQLDAEGHLLLRHADGTLHRQSAGEVSVLAFRNYEG